MKKQYTKPVTASLKIKIDHALMAGLTGNIENVTISSTETISDDSQFGSRSGAFWDDDE